MSLFLTAQLEQNEKEFDFLCNLQIFNEAEIKSMRRNRTNFECSLSSDPFFAFYKYIEYEKKILKIIKKRTNSLDSAKYTIRRIISLYTRALDKNIYSEHYNTLIIGYIKFMLKNQNYSELKHVLHSQCLKKLNDTDLYLLCAQTFLKIHDFETAKVFLLKGLRITTEKRDKKRLMTGLFDIELVFLSSCRKINDEAGIENDSEAECDSLLVIFKDFYKTFGACNEVDEMLIKAEAHNDLYHKLVESIKSDDIKE